MPNPKMVSSVWRLGLGKTIVDSGKCWNYSPTFPNAFPPYINLNEMLKATQTQLWAVNMGKPPEYDPIHETEYLITGKSAGR